MNIHTQTPITISMVQKMMVKRPSKFGWDWTLRMINNNTPNPNARAVVKIRNIDRRDINAVATGSGKRSRMKDAS